MPAPAPAPSPVAEANPFDSASATRAVTRAYRAILFREPDSGGLAGYVSQLTRDGKPGMSRMIEGMATSQEFLAGSHSDQERLSQLYSGFLLRGVDGSGQAAYLPMIQSGHFVDAALAVGTSAEFFSALALPDPAPAPAPAPKPTVAPAPPVDPTLPPPNELASVQAVDQANPGLLHSDCSQFLKAVVQALRSKDANWGYCNKPGKGKIPADILMYGAGGKLVDFVSSSCSPTAGIYWSVLDPNPECVWSAEPQYPIK